MSLFSRKSKDWNGEKCVIFVANSGGENTLFDSGTTVCSEELKSLIFNAFTSQGEIVSEDSRIVLPALYYDDVIDAPPSSIKKESDFPQDFIDAMMIFMNTGEKPAPVTVMNRTLLHDFNSRRKVWMFAPLQKMLLFAVEV